MRVILLFFRLHNTYDQLTTNGFFISLWDYVSISLEDTKQETIKNIVDPHVVRCLKQVMNLIFCRLSFLKLECSKSSLPCVAMPTVASDFQRRYLLL